MTSRSLNLPQDLKLLAEFTPATFQYPDNPEWSIASDEADEMVDSMNRFYRLWPLVRVMQILSPAMRDILHGYVEEEGGRTAGTIVVSRRGLTDKWEVGNVSVHPDFRRRGLGRKLVAAGLEKIRERGGKAALLDVISANVPATKLYEAMGFETFSGKLEMQRMGDDAVDTPTLPPGLRRESFDLFDWQPRYELAKRTTPSTEQAFQPVEEGTFRQPGLVRVLYPLTQMAFGKRQMGLFLYAGDKAIGWGRADLRTRAEGFNSLGGRVDPDYPQAAVYIMTQLVSWVNEHAPGRRDLITLPSWQTNMIEAAKAVGFEGRIEYQRMGITLS